VNGGGAAGDDEVTHVRRVVVDATREPTIGTALDLRSTRERRVIRRKLAAIRRFVQRGEVTFVPWSRS
jgi:hypothetical protein